MDETGFQPMVLPDRRPRSVTWVVVLIWVQVVANAFGGWLLLYLAKEDEDHGREVSDLVYVLGYASFLAAALLAVCAVLLTGRRLAWPRYTVIVVEWLLITAWFMTLLSAEGSGAGIPPVIPAIVAIQLCKRDLASWYDDSPHRR